MQLIPNPKKEWDASMWIYASIGEVYFIIKHYKESYDYFYNALNCLSSYSNPYILLRIEQTLHECNNKKGIDYLFKAYMLEGYKIFHDEDIRYYNLIKALI